jgi:hypothetical protein
MAWSDCFHRAVVAEIQWSPESDGPLGSGHHNRQTQGDECIVIIMSGDAAMDRTRSNTTISMVIRLPDPDKALDVMHQAISNGGARR